ncbi:MAG: HisA/HisF-related TIM barrel protein, partial [Ilumatobacteraceae bacterium]
DVDLYPAIDLRGGRVVRLEQGDFAREREYGTDPLQVARQFADATQVTGVVLTKLDGSAKGGIVFAIETELSIPVKLVGLGETIGDLVAFDPDEFVDALFD